MIYLFFRLGFSQTGRIAQGNANNIIMMSLLNMIVRTYVLDIVQVTTTPVNNKCTVRSKFYHLQY